MIVGGFSYGAATAALSATKNPDDYIAAVLLDGWFNVDLASIEGCPSDEQVAFPPLSHEKGVPVPALFVGSSEFAGVCCCAPHSSINV
jgi:pimeloyl-ACP methyl ester carboxylesterase